MKLCSWTTYHALQIQLIQAKQTKPYSVDLYLQLYKYKTKLYKYVVQKMWIEYYIGIV